MINKNHINLRKYISFNGLLVVPVFLSGMLLSQTALAQSKLDTESQGAESSLKQESSTPSEGLSLNLNVSQGNVLNSQYNLAPLDLPAESVGSTLFKLDLSDTNCITGGSTCLRRYDEINAALSKSITSISQTGLDFSLTPRASLRFNDDAQSAIVGAKFEIGEDLSIGSNIKNNTWYFFAGADAEALSYSPNSLGRLTSGQFHLQDRIIVGDAQAGLGYRLGDTDVSLSYMRREASADDFSFKEDAAALSFTWKR